MPYWYCHPRGHEEGTVESSHPTQAPVQQTIDLKREHTALVEESQDLWRTSVRGVLVQVPYQLGRLDLLHHERMSTSSCA